MELRPRIDATLSSPASNVAEPWDSVRAATMLKPLSDCEPVDPSECDLASASRPMTWRDVTFSYWEIVVAREKHTDRTAANGLPSPR